MNEVLFSSSMGNTVTCDPPPYTASINNPNVSNLVMQTRWAVADSYMHPFTPGTMQIQEDPLEPMVYVPVEPRGPE